MDIKKNFKTQNMRIFSWVICIPTIVIMMWSIFTSIGELNKLLDYSTPSVEKIVSDFEINNLKLTKTTINKTEIEKTYIYVTTKDLSYLASKTDQSKTISTNFGFTKMIGLESYPSFLVTEKHESFWRFQFYLEIIFNYGGFALLFLILFIYSEVNFKQERKLFTKEIKWVFVGLSGTFLGAYFIELLLYGRMIYFLNTEFYLGESLVGGSQYLLNLGIIFLFLSILIDKAIPMQEEQELTV